MLFISPQKLFSFSKCWSFCLDFLVLHQNCLIRKIRLTSKFMTSQHGKQTIVIHVLPSILRNKENQALKFGQLREYNMKNIFLEKPYKNCGGETSFRFFSERLNLSIPLHQQSTFYSVRFIASLSGWLPQFIKTKLLTTCFYFL